MAKEQYASVRPSKMEEGGSFGFPAQSIVTIVEAAWATWGEAGEGALKGGFRSADDPCLKLVGEVEGSDAVENPSEFLGAGKASKFEPSRDGEHLLGIGAINKTCNAAVFLTSVSDKKQQGKLAMDEALFDDNGISSLVGLKFRVGKITVKREGLEVREGAKAPRPTLVSEENLELPSGKKGGGKTSSSSGKSSGKSKKDEDEDEDTDTDVDTDKLAETAVLEALDLPKYRKGLNVEDQLYTAVHNVTKAMNDLDSKTRKAVMALVSDADWATDKDRPWEHDDGVLTKA